MMSVELGLLIGGTGLMLCASVVTYGRAIVVLAALWLWFAAFALVLLA